MNNEHRAIQACYGELRLGMDPELVEKARKAARKRAGRKKRQRKSEKGLVTPEYKRREAALQGVQGLTLTKPISVIESNRFKIHGNVYHGFNKSGNDYYRGTFYYNNIRYGKSFKTEAEARAWLDDALRDLREKGKVPEKKIRK